MWCYGCEAYVNHFRVPEVWPAYTGVSWQSSPTIGGRPSDCQALRDHSPQLHEAKFGSPPERPQPAAAPTLTLG